MEAQYGELIEMRHTMNDTNEEQKNTGWTRLQPEIESDPQMLQKMEQIQFVQTPLHDAAAGGDTIMAMELMNLAPSLGRKLNPQGLTPLHVAIEKGRVETALMLVRFDKQLIRVKGRDGLTPLHCAAMKTDVRLLARFLLDCPESIYDVNNRFQTAVVVALESRNFDAFEVLMKWIIRSAREPVLAMRDATGNSLIHYVILYGGFQNMLKFVKLQKVNKKNYEGKTPLDIAMDQCNHNPEGDKIIKLLKDAGARRSEDIPTKKDPTEYLQSKYKSLTEGFIRTYYLLTLDLSLEIRNVILVVAVLIYTATYQGVLQPPGGMYQASVEDPTPAPSVSYLRLQGGGPRAGQMVMPTDCFMPTNTAAFVLSTVIIIFVLPSRPFRPLIILLQASMVFMCVGYLRALMLISGTNRMSREIVDVSMSVILYAFFSKILYFVVTAIANNQIWWARRFRAAIGDFQPRDDGAGIMMPMISFVRRMRWQKKLLDGNPDFLV